MNIRGEIKSDKEMNIDKERQNDKERENDRERQSDMLLALDYIMNHCIHKKGSRSKTVHNMAFFFNSKVNDPKRLL